MSAINDGVWLPMLTEDRIREIFYAQPALRPDLMGHRTIRCVSPAYLDALERIFVDGNIDGWVKKFAADGFGAKWEPNPEPAVRITPDGKLVEVAS